MRKREVIVSPANARRLFLTAISTAILSWLLPLSIAAAAPPAREAIEWCDIWISHANETNLPRVLLIGDSIVRDYYPEVEKQLAGKAFVARLATSRFVSDPVLLKEIELVLHGSKFDVIVFNNGMHGWQHNEAEYQRAFPKFIKTIRAQAPKANLIWATTTPLREGKGVTYDTKAAEALGVSVATVKNYWTFARTWILQRDQECLAGCALPRGMKASAVEFLTQPF